MARKPAGAPVALGQRIRKRRQMMSMTLQELSNACGVSVSYLSQVERDNATPTLGTLAEIAAALDVGIEHFIATPRQSDSVTRASERQQFAVSGTSVIYERIGAEFPGHELTSFVLNVPAGYASETIQHAGEELIFVLDGEILQVVDGQQFLLRPGDSIHYLGQHPHSWSNPGDRMARLLWTGKMLHGATPSAHIPHEISSSPVPDETRLDAPEGAPDATAK
ncbi:MULTISPECIES: helix-turn-helix domain-containing protein [Gemmobacter]|uniref:XRE family transcriptional regulator n=2 Tax=Gemmobacter TaxID=204456 RepID=A0A2T6ATB9_9RHOB|nr:MULTISPECIES: cupin domain-containing protein [Gemmobacter]OJY36240.1 MAG: XRE family transcriptional regulator [Rhodobacterales bacterium 65-51]PTX47070.1 XRE family transcriptional regulator [Gemmobacter caeni]TWI96073.1 XRE family transcriptional regulator [Gemmobacter caeni]